MSSNYFKIVFSLLIAEKLQKEIWKVIVCLTINSKKNDIKSVVLQISYLFLKIPQIMSLKGEYSC